MDKLFVPVLLGTARVGRQSEQVARLVVTEAQKYGFESELVDVKDYPLTMTAKNPTSAWAEKISRASGLIIVAPEYNHGYPGELKLLLDSLYEEYRDLPVGLCGVSAGPVGGARMLMALTPVMVELGLRIIRPLNLFPAVQGLFDAAGQISDQKILEKLEKTLAGIQAAARVKKVS